MTSQAPVEKTRSTPDGDALPAPRTERPYVITGSAITSADAPTGVLTIGVDDAAVRGVDEVLGREVRLVTLPPATGDVLSERIEQVRHLARLHHPHLLEIYDVDGLAPDTESTLVLENVPGEPLALVLRDGPIPEPELARMGAQLASALAHAHAHGVEHGAIGAASILVDRAHADAWLVGLTASLSGPLPVVGPEPDDDGEDAARRRAADVRALAAILTEVVEHAAATIDGDDPEAVTRPTTLDAAAPGSPLAALLREVEAEPPSAAVLSEQLVRVGRGVAVREGRAEPARLVPVVASWSERPATAGVPQAERPAEPVAPAAVTAGPAVRARGAGGVMSFGTVGPAGRRARRAGVLGAATATLALASGLVIWAGESHLVRPDSQAAIGASAPSAIPVAPLVPQATDAGASSGGGGGTWTGEIAGTAAGSGHTAVGVASRQGAVREAAPTTDRTSPADPSSGPPPGATRPNHPVPPPSTTRPTPSDPPDTPTTTPPTTPPTTTTRATTQPTTTQPTTTQPTSTQPTTTQRVTTQLVTTQPTASSQTSTSSTSSTTDPTQDTATTETQTAATTTTASRRTVLAAGT